MVHSKKLYLQYARYVLRISKRYIGFVLPLRVLTKYYTLGLSNYQNTTRLTGAPASKATEEKFYPSLSIRCVCDQWDSFLVAIIVMGGSITQSVHSRYGIRPGGLLDVD
jgi:hypothetical protein